MDSFDPFASARARRNGLRRFLVGFALFAVASVPVWFLFDHGRQLDIHTAAGLAVPGAYALSGLIEFVTEVPFTELASRWDSLKGWQRGVLGTFIVVAAFLLIMVTIGLWAS